MVGFGCILIDLAVFRQIPMPWFGHPGAAGEDTAFCGQCGSVGIPVLVDHDLSRHVAHKTTRLLGVDTPSFDSVT